MIRTVHAHSSAPRCMPSATKSSSTTSRPSTYNCGTYILYFAEICVDAGVDGCRLQRRSPSEVL